MDTTKRAAEDVHYVEGVANNSWTTANTVKRTILLFQELAIYSKERGNDCGES